MRTMSAITSYSYLKELANTQRSSKTHDLGANELSFLCIRIQKELIYIDATRIGEVIPFSGVSPVGHTAPWFEGLLKIQGQIYSVLDISSFLGYKSSVKRKEFVIALSEANDNVSIIAEELFGLQKFTKIHKVSEENYLDTYRAVDKNIQVLSIDRLLTTPEFTHISIF